MKEDRSFWILAIVFIVLAIPLEAAIMWSIWMMKGWAVPFFVLLGVAFLFAPEKSRDYISTHWQREAGSIMTNMRMGLGLETDDVFIPPPPNVPRDYASLTPCSTLPSPPLAAPRTMHEFSEAMSRITTRPPPAIN